MRSRPASRDARTRRSPAIELVAVQGLRDEHRLEHAVLADAGRELLEPLVVHVASRLVRVRGHAGERHVDDCRRGGRALRDQRREPAPERGGSAVRLDRHATAPAYAAAAVAAAPAPRPVSVATASDAIARAAIVPGPRRPRSSAASVRTPRRPWSPGGTARSGSPWLGASERRTLRGTIVSKTASSQVPPDLGGDLGRQVRPCVEHRQHDTGDRQLGVEVVAHEVDRRDQLREALERVVLALDRDQHRVRAGQRVHRQQAKRRRAVDEDPVPVRRLPVDRAREAPLAALLAGELDLRPGERDRRRDETQALDGCRDVQVTERPLVDERVVDRAVQGGAVDPEAARRVALGIEVDDEDAVTEESQIGCEIDHGRGLPDAAFLIGAGDRLAHSASSSSRTHVLEF